jgi:hypothetical protein
MRKVIFMLLTAMAMVLPVAASIAPAGAQTTHSAVVVTTQHTHRDPVLRTGTAPPAPGVNCTQGVTDYGVGAVTVSTDWEPPGSCGWHLRSCLLDSTNTTRCGGFVKATELVTTTPQANGTMASGWLQEYLSAGTQRWCWDVYRPVSTAWHKCSGTGF